MYSTLSHDGAPAHGVIFLKIPRQHRQEEALRETDDDESIRMVLVDLFLKRKSAEKAGTSFVGHQRRRKGAAPRQCRCSLFKGFVLLVALFFVLTFYSAIHLSDVERTKSFLTPESAAFLVGGYLDVNMMTDDTGSRNKTNRQESLNEKTIQSTWTFIAAEAEEVQRHLLRTTGRTSPLLTAYIEPPLRNDTATLPLRTQGPDELRRYTYPKVNGCKNLQDKLPTLHPIELDDIYGSNVFNRQPLYLKRFDYANDACPVDSDPFLPWIHDVFPSKEYVEFIAHNKRRCNTDPNVFQQDLVNLEAQVTIMQPVPVRRITNEEARVDRT